MLYQPLLVGDMIFKSTPHYLLYAVIFSAPFIMAPAVAELPTEYSGDVRNKQKTFNTKKSQPVKNNIASVTFTVSPESCLVKNNRTSCIDQLEFYWRLSTPKRVCLETKAGKRLHCITNKSTQRVLVNFNVLTTTVFYLVDAESQQQLAQTQVMVVKNVNSDIGSRRYRHPWSIF